MMRLKIGGYWAEEVGEWGDLSWVDRWPGGFYEASWSMGVPAGFRHPALTRGAIVEIMDGTLRVRQGILTEPDRDSWRLVAEGLVRQAESYYALDGAGNSTSVPDTAIDAAIVRGLPWVRRTSLSSVAVTEGAGTDALNSLSTLLDLASDEAGKRLHVDADGTVSFQSDPTEPVWHVTPGSVELGIASTEYASHVLGRYKRLSDSTYRTVTASDLEAEAAFGHREHLVDLTSLGAISQTRATNITTGILEKGRAQLGWTNGLTVTRFELTNPGGESADLSAVRAGDLIRIHGMFDDTRTHEGRSFVDIVAGEVIYTNEDQAIRINPVGLAPRTLASVTEDALRRAASGVRA